MWDPPSTSPTAGIFNKTNYRGGPHLFRWHNNFILLDSLKGRVVCTASTLLIGLDWHLHGGAHTKQPYRFLHSRVPRVCLSMTAREVPLSEGLVLVIAYQPSPFSNGDRCLVTKELDGMMDTLRISL